EDLALEDPHLDADHPIGGQRLGLGIVDVGAQRMQRHAAFPIPFDAGDLGAAETAAARDLDAFGAEPERRLHRALHRTAESDAANELVGDALRDELGVDLRLADFDDVQLHLAGGHLRELRAQLFDVGALLADDDARTGGIDRHAAQLRGPLDHHLGDRRLRQRPDDELADLEVFLKQLAVVAAFGEPAAVPGPVDLETQADGVCLVTHGSGLPVLVGCFADHDAQPAERLEDAGRLAASARVEALHGDRLADAGFGNHQRV